VATCQPRIGHYVHMFISRMRKAVWNFPAFGPDVCLWLTRSTFTNHSYFSRPTLSFLSYAYDEAPIWPSTVDLGRLALDHPYLCASYHVAPKRHIAPSTWDISRIMGFCPLPLIISPRGQLLRKTPPLYK
jgi:hypothetical protein